MNIDDLENGPPVDWRRPGLLWTGICRARYEEELRRSESGPKHAPRSAGQKAPSMRHAPKDMTQGRIGATPVQRTLMEKWPSENRGMAQRFLAWFKGR